MGQETGKVKNAESQKPVRDKSKPISSTPIQGTAWCVVWTGDKRVFFFKPSTKESLWECPKELKGKPEVQRLLQKPPASDDEEDENDNKNADKDKNDENNDAKSIDKMQADGDEIMNDTQNRKNIPNNDNDLKRKHFDSLNENNGNLHNNDGEKPKKQSR